MNANNAAAPRLTLLTSRTGRKVRTAVTMHARNYLEGATVCGIPFATLDAQDLRVHQTSVCGSNSDLTCPTCIAGSKQIVAAGRPAGYSARSGAKLHHVKQNGVVVGTITTLYPDLVIVRLNSRPCADQTFASYMDAWRSIMES